MKTTPVCTIRSVDNFERKHIVKNDDARYWIRCRLCPPGEIMLDRIFGGRRTLGYTCDLETAIRYADAHATIHLDQTCTACHHTPTVEVPAEDTNALMTARSAQ